MTLSDKEINLSKKIGNELFSILSREFVETKFIRNGFFYPPTDFFRDPYIIGFCLDYVSSITHDGIDSSKWSQDKILKFMTSTWDIVDPNKNLTNFILRFGHNIEYLNTDDKSFKEGRNAAIIYLLTLYDKPDPNDQDKLLKDAIRIAPNLHEFKDIMHITDNDLKNYRLPLTVLMLSIFKHISEKWIIHSCKPT